MMGRDIQVRHLEKWLDDVLNDCSELKVKGSLEVALSKKPLTFYELDRYYLNTLGLTTQ